MWLYTKMQYKSAIEDKDKEIEEVWDTFRGEIIQNLEFFVKSEDYNEKYKLLLRHKGYYESIKNDLQKKKIDEVFKKYDLCFRHHGFWGLLDEIVYENNQLWCWVDFYHSLPPDYIRFPLDEIPTKVLYKALRIFKGQ